MIFKKQADFKFFEQNGYVSIDLLNDVDVDALQELYVETKHEAGLETKFHTSIWSDNAAYKDRVNAGIRSILAPALDKVLKDYQCAFANFMVKKSGYSSSLQAHQDWTFVQEPEYYSITVWVPLMDVTEENGALEVLPGSHKLSNFVRARFMDSPFSAHNKYIEENLMKSIPLKKGKALLVNSRTIHASPDNLSGEDRMVASIVVYPKEASLVHYVLENPENKELVKLNIDPNFFIKYSCFDQPNEAVDSKVPVKGMTFTLDQLINL